MPDVPSNGPTHATRPRANVLGIGIDAITPDIALDRLFATSPAERRGYVCVTGVHGVMEAQRDEELRRILNESMLTVPDGMPTVWMGHMQGHRAMARVYGPTLLLDVCRRSVGTGSTHFFFGGAPGVADELARALTSRY